MSLGEGLSIVDEGEGVEEDGGVLDLPHGRGLWSSACQSWLARGSGLMALAGLSPDLAQWPSLGLSAIFNPCQLI